jgi:hypothetical protein
LVSPEKMVKCVIFLTRQETAGIIGIQLQMKKFVCAMDYRRTSINYIIFFLTKLF